jgi:hypothetical protein
MEETTDDTVHEDVDVLDAQETPQDPTPEQTQPPARPQEQPPARQSVDLAAITSRLDTLEKAIAELKAHDTIFNEPVHDPEPERQYTSVDDAVAALFDEME